MHFAYHLPWWLGAIVAGAIAAAAFLQYRRPLAPLTWTQRGVLALLRVLVLGGLVALLFRPIALLPPSGPRDAVVPVLVDVSRSMRVADRGDETRMARASRLLNNDLLPALRLHFMTEVYGFGEGLAPLAEDRPRMLHPSAEARRSDLTGALAAIRERYRGQRVAGIVVLSDGGDTGSGAAAGDSGRREPPGSGQDGTGGPAVFTIGIGSPNGLIDREVVSITAGDPRLDQASVDLHVTCVSSGFGRAPFPLRVLANGRLLETRRVVPPADGSPIDETFTVSPDPLTPTVYTAQIPADESEMVTENNARSVLVSPAGRKRRLLIIEGAPGFEHSFMTRALSADTGLEIDVVTRKGRNVENQDTFFVQAPAARSAGLTAGFPATRELLYSYDALVIANVEGESFPRAQLQSAADFVSERGGGLLVLGGRTFAQRGLSGTPLEEALPVELNDRRGGLVRTLLEVADLPAHNKVVVTREGEAHPIMRLGALEETRRRWAALPALAASAPLGTPRPGASILALTTAPGGGVYPVVAVQRYGHGRSMVFAGEASWRWRMLVPSTDRTYDFFWRQAVRWLASDAPDPVAITLPEAPEPDDSVAIAVDARDSAFMPVRDAAVEATVTAPGGEATPLKLRRTESPGRLVATLSPRQPGLYRFRAQARRGAVPPGSSGSGEPLGSAERWMYVGAGDREFADPRLNEPLLRRIARTSGGRYAHADDAARVPGWLQEVEPQNARAEQRDLWHEPWAFALIIALLSAEWVLRRLWGLR
jgi:uncharacterized membrane protein